MVVHLEEASRMGLRAGGTLSPLVTRDGCGSRRSLERHSFLVTNNKDLSTPCSIKPYSLQLENSSLPQPLQESHHTLNRPDALFHTRHYRRSSIGDAQHLLRATKTIVGCRSLGRDLGKLAEEPLVNVHKVPELGNHRFEIGSLGPERERVQHNGGVIWGGRDEMREKERGVAREVSRLYKDTFSVSVRPGI